MAASKCAQTCVATMGGPRNAAQHAGWRRQPIAKQLAPDTKTNAEFGRGAMFLPMRSTIPNTLNNAKHNTSTCDHISLASGHGASNAETQQHGRVTGETPPVHHRAMPRRMLITTRHRHAGNTNVQQTHTSQARRPINRRRHPHTRVAAGWKPCPGALPDCSARFNGKATG